MKIIIFDDDPTGSQSVYGCPLILKWDQETLAFGIENSSSLLFILANTRALPNDLAKKRIQDISQRIKEILNEQGMTSKEVLFVSRGDSTLRGHGFLEPNVLAEELGPFDATFHVPAFFEGGRTTVNGIHLLNGSPVHLTNFASDQIFGFSTSYLPDWLQEKSNYAIQAKSVIRLTLEQLNSALETDAGMQDLIIFLKALNGNAMVVVDAEKPAHLFIFSKAIIQLMREKRFLFRSAASLIKAFADLPLNPNQQSSLISLRLRDKSFCLKTGLILVGSHVKLADQQLEFLLKDPNCEGLELPVDKISKALDSSYADISLNDLEHLYFSQLKKIIKSGRTPVFFTSRGELNFSSVSRRMLFGSQLAELMSRIVYKVSPDLGYIISKGGITTQTLLEQGFNFSKVELKGQILPGLSLVCPYIEDDLKRIPIITFPGNLGGKETLLESWKLMESVIK